MATLSDGGRITEEVVKDEILRLRRDWSAGIQKNDPMAQTAKLLDESIHSQLDLFDHIQLAGVAEACKNSQSMAEAGRLLFAKSRLEKTTVNDSHRLKQYLDKFGLKFEQLRRS
jgi:transcriptional regulatory protein RtcR